MARQGDTEARLAQARRVLAEAQRSAGAQRPHASMPPNATRGTPAGGQRRPKRSQGDETTPIDPATPRIDIDPATQSSDADGQAIARQIVLRQLALGPRSRAQLESKLRSRGCDEHTAARVLDRFTEVGLIDDEAFAEVLIRSQQTTRGLSRRALAHELSRKGVDREVRDAALANIDEDGERERAEALVAARLKRLAGLPREVQQRRLSAMLARKGYPTALRLAVIRRALDSSDEHRRD